MNSSSKLALRLSASFAYLFLALSVAATACDSSGGSGSRGVDTPSADGGAVESPEDSGVSPATDAEGEPTVATDAGPSDSASADADGPGDGDEDAEVGGEPPTADASPTEPVEAPADAGKAPTKTPRPEKRDAGTPSEPAPTKQPEPTPVEPTPSAPDAGADGGAAEATGDGGTKVGPSSKVRELTTLVSEAYSKAHGFEADFEQTYRNRLLGRNQDSTGHVWLRPPTRMRWEYRTPTNNLIVADGRMLFVFEPEPNQVIRMPVGDSELPAVMAFLTGGRDLNEDYHVKLVSAEVTAALAKRGQAGLELRPRRPSSVVERVVLVIGRDNGRVQKTVLVEPEGNTNTFVWSKVRTDTKIADSRFTFTPPSGARILER